MNNIIVMDHQFATLQLEHEISYTYINIHMRSIDRYVARN